MTTFPIGTKVRVLCDSRSRPWFPYIKGDVGVVVGDGGGYRRGEETVKVEWPTHKANGYGFWYTFVDVIVPASIFYAETDKKGLVI